MAVLSREQILARKLGREGQLVALGDGSGEVRVRGLSRKESHAVGALEAAGDTFEMEALALSYALVEPAMTLDEVRTWLSEDASGAIQPAVDAVQRLSGTGEGQAKEYTKSVSRGRRARH